jgi:hypothetical protein
LQVGNEPITAVDFSGTPARVPAAAKGAAKLENREEFRNAC